jgi:hypothetical protein
VHEPARRRGGAFAAAAAFSNAFALAGVIDSATAESDWMVALAGTFALGGAFAPATAFSFTDSFAFALGGAFAPANAFSSNDSFAFAAAGAFARLGDMQAARNRHGVATRADQ